MCACLCTVSQHAGHVDAPERADDSEVSLAACGRVKMALEGLGEDDASVIRHVDRAHP